MPIKFNPLAGQFDLVGSGGGGASYIDGEVATYNDLPLDGTAALNSAWLVREASGIWPVSRKQAGIYIRTATAGSSRDADYTYAGTMPDVFSDAVFTLYDDASTTRTGQFNLGSITAGQNRVLTWPDGNGTIARTSDIPSTFAASAITSGVLDNARINFAAPSAIGSTTPSTGAFTTLNATNGTITASAPVLDLAQTWNNAAAAFTGIRLNVTNTASANTSDLLNLQIGGTTQFRIRGSTLFLGEFTLSGLYTPSPSYIGSTGALMCATQFAVGNNLDTILIRDGAAGTLAQRNGTNPQTFRLYNTFTDASNYERGFMRWSSNVLQIGTEKGGTGSARNVQLQRDGTTFLTLESSSAQAFNSWVFFGTVFANGGITMTGSGNPLVISGSNNIVEQRNGANSQTFRLFNTHTSSTSFECLNIAAQSAGSFIIGTEKGSVGGTARGLELRTDNTARLTFGASGTITLNTTLAADAQNISTDTTTGTKIGTGTTQKLGFFNATPVDQPNTVADPTGGGTIDAEARTAINDIIDRLQELGLIA